MAVPLEVLLIVRNSSVESHSCLMKELTTLIVLDDSLGSYTCFTKELTLLIFLNDLRDDCVRSVSPFLKAVKPEFLLLIIGDDGNSSASGCSIVESNAELCPSVNRVASAVARNLLSVAQEGSFLLTLVLLKVSWILWLSMESFSAQKKPSLAAGLIEIKLNI